jgi:hypothetical protein
MKTQIIWLILALASISCNKENKKPDLKFTGEAKGCSSFVVYKFNGSINESIAVTGIRDSLNLTTSEKSFDLQTVNSNNLKIEIKRFDGDASGYHCDDIADNAPKVISTWTGINGTVKIQIVQDSIATNPQGKPEYKISVILEKVNFQNDNDKNVFIDNIEFKEVYVGWLPG